MNKRILIKQLGFKSTMKLRDFVAFRMDEDRDDLEDLGRYLEVERGDIVAVITLKPPKLKRKSTPPQSEEELDQ